MIRFESFINNLIGFILFCTSYNVLSSALLPDEQALFNKLFNDQQYDNSVRPVFNSSKNVEVEFGFTLIQIMDMDEKNQLLVLNAWLEMRWTDERIGWNVNDYNGLEVVRIPAKMLWLPDIVLYNKFSFISDSNADVIYETCGVNPYITNADDYTAGFMPINAMVDANGTISWGPPARLKSSCKVDITYFPFDHQVCSLKFGSWTYDKAQVDLLTMSGKVEVSRYTTNGEWMLTKYEIVRNEVIYPISPAIYPDVTVILTIQRRILYYVLNILFPCFWLNILSVLTFCLPPDAGEKITLSITVLLSYSVFMLLVAESMPPTSEFVPLIGIYLTVSMAVASVSVILTVVVLKLHHCSPSQKKIPRWVRHYILGYLARFVRCSCVPMKCKIPLMRKRASIETDIDMKEFQTKLLRQMESMTLKNGNNRLNSENISKHHVSVSVKNSSVNDLNNSKMNLDIKDFSVSNRSSMVEEDIAAIKRDRSLAAMEDILKYLKVLVVKSDAEDAVHEIVDEWKQVALVIDRLFFWMFLFITIMSSVTILVIAPSFKYIADDGI